MQRRAGLSLLALLLAALGQAAEAAAPQPCAFTDLMPAYQAFLSATATLTPAQRAAAFVSDFAARYPDYYAPEVFGDPAKLEARAVRFFDPAQQRRVFQDVEPASAARIEELGAAIGPEFAAQQRRFLETFPDFVCDSRVEFGISLNRFDGHPAQFGGANHLLFGVDVIATLHGVQDMPALFDHELFHLYHRQVIGAAAPKGDDPAWWTLWVEGLATYVSQRMNPQLKPQEVLWYPRDMVARMSAERSRAAQLLLADINKSGKEADRWFLADQSVEGLPFRAGYELGYEFAATEGRGVPLPVLARRSPERVHRDAIRFLTRMAHAQTQRP